MRRSLAAVGGVTAALLLALLGTAPAQAATDTTGPNITMQPTGHIVVNSVNVTGTPAPFDGNQVYSTQVEIRWSGSDPSGICDYQVYYDSFRDYPWFWFDNGTKTSFRTMAGDLDEGNGGYNEFGVIIRAMDCAGNWSNTSYDPGPGGYGYPFPGTDRFLGLQENVNYLTSSDDTSGTHSGGGAWTRSTCACFMGGSDIHASAAGAALGKTYGSNWEGLSFAIVGAYGPARGAFKVYQDGVYKGTFTEYAAKNTPARVVWSAWFATPGLHTIKVVVVGTAGHPRVDIDGFFVH